MNKKILTLLFVFLLAGILVVNLASAEFWACFQEGERIDYCDNYKPSVVCDHTICERCEESYSEAENCYIHGVWAECYKIPPDCSNQGGDFNFTPLNFTANAPENDSIYNTRLVPFELESNKESSYYYTDAINGRGRWSRLCSRCTSFNRGVNFKDGYNEILLKAIADNDEEVSVSRSFYVDSKEPRIKRLEPRQDKYADGNFSITYDEENIKEFKLEYGNYDVGYKTKVLSCPDGKNQECSAFVDLKDYDGQEIEYWFFITDIADNYDESRHVRVKVDTTFPVINHPLVEGADYKIEGRYVYFNISVKEENFDSVGYIDWNEPRPRWRTLCTRLKNGICEKKISFRYGSHDLSIQVTDEAGNAVAEGIEFEI